MFLKSVLRISFLAHKGYLSGVLSGGFWHRGVYVLIPSLVEKVRNVRKLYKKI